MNTELWEKVTKRHGHECAGVAFGFRIGQEVIKIFDEEENIICKTAIEGCALDGVVLTLGLAGVKGRLIKEAKIESFIFYAEGDVEGWKVTPKKIDVAPEADPVLLILSLNRDMLLDIEPIDLEFDPKA